jgi:dienelactone hydrolase
MIRRHRAWLSGVVSIGALALASPAQVAGVGQNAPRFQVGIPGCQDDVAVQATRELVTFQSRGRPIRAYLYTPKGQPNGAAMVLLHGGTGFEMNSILFDAHAIQLASRGYWVLLPAYFDAWEPSATQRTVSARAWKQVALDAVRNLEARPGVESGRVTLWGYSRGGGVALDAVTSPESPSRSAILVASGGRPDSDQVGANLSFLLMHARRDEAVSARTTIRSAEALREAGAMVEISQLDFDGHQFDLATWCDVMSRSRAFMDRH